jgi:hypothetical protein
MEFLTGLNGPGLEVIGINWVFKLLFVTLVVGYIIYSILLVLRVRILSDTIETIATTTVKLMTTGHLLLSFVGGFLAMIVILLA